MPLSQFWDAFTKIFDPAVRFGAGVFGARAVGGAARTQAAAELEAAGLEAGVAREVAALQAQTARENLDLWRNIYNQTVKLSFPQFQVGTKALEQVAIGGGLKLPMGAFDVADKPPELPAPSAPTVPGGFQGPGTDSSSTLSAALEAAPRPPSFAGNLARNTLSGAVTGVGAGALASAITGIPLGPVGIVGGATIGGIKSLFGRGRREANQIVPFQNALAAEMTKAADFIRSKGDAATPEDFAAAYNRVKPLRDQFVDLTQKFGLAGPGTRETTAKFTDQILEDWAQKGGITPRRHGGFAGPGRQYLVGEAGPEILEMAPGSEGFIYPNSTFSGGFVNPSLALTLSRRRGGPVSGEDKVALVMREFNRGKLRSSSGRKVTSRKQALAIALSEAGLSRRQGGGPVSGPGFFFDPSNPAHFRRPADLPEFDPQNPAPYYAALGNRIATDPLLAGQFAFAERNRLPGSTGPTINPLVGTGSILEGTFKPAMPSVLQPDVATSVASASPGTRQQTVLPGAALQPDISSQGTGRTGGAGQQSVTVPSGGFTGPGQQNVSAQSTSTEALIRQYGWTQNAAGQWIHPETGAVGRFTSGGQFINETAGKIFDPRTGQVTDFQPGGFTAPTSPFDAMGPPFEITKGEFIRPFQGQFKFDPATGGFQPFSEPFRFDPTTGGYQPLNQPFRFTAEDLYSDPGYKFRLSEGEKAVLRAASAGLTVGGRTLKDLTRFAQDLASQEFQAAHNRGLQRFGLGRQAEQEARGRALGEFGLRAGQAELARERARQEFDLARNIFLENQQRRRNFFLALAGLPGQENASSFLGGGG